MGRTSLICVLYKFNFFCQNKFRLQFFVIHNLAMILFDDLFKNRKIFCIYQFVEHLSHQIWSKFDSISSDTLKSFAFILWRPIFSLIHFTIVPFLSHKKESIIDFLKFHLNRIRKESSYLKSQLFPNIDAVNGLVSWEMEKYTIRIPIEHFALVFLVSIQKIDGLSEQVLRCFHNRICNFRTRHSTCKRSSCVSK